MARTCAKMSGDAVFDAIRCKFMQFQAGIVDVKIHGSGPSFGSV